MKSIPDLLFGSKLHSYKIVSEHEANVQFSPVKGDRRYVLFTLKAIYKGRMHGPKWARKKEFVGYIVHWYTDRGIPIKNTSQGQRMVKKADFRLSEEEVDLSALGWQKCAEQDLGKQIADIRTHNGFYFEGVKLRANNEVR